MAPRRKTAKKRGRPSLTGSGTSPTINFRVPTPLRDQIEAVASREHKTVSEVLREALETHLTAV